MEKTESKTKKFMLTQWSVGANGETSVPKVSFYSSKELAQRAMGMSFQNFKRMMYLEHDIDLDSDNADHTCSFDDDFIHLRVGNISRHWVIKDCSDETVDTDFEKPDLELEKQHLIKELYKYADCACVNFVTNETEPLPELIQKAIKFLRFSVVNDALSEYIND